MKIKQGADVAVIIREVSEEGTCEQEWKGTGYEDIGKKRVLLEATVIQCPEIGGCL